MSDRERLNDLAISESGVVFDPYTGATYSVNPTGRRILAGLRDGRDRAAIAGELAACYETGGRDVGRDVDEFVLLLRTNGLLTAEAVV